MFLDHEQNHPTHLVSSRLSAILTEFLFYQYTHSDCFSILIVFIFCLYYYSYRLYLIFKYHCVTYYILTECLYV